MKIILSAVVLAVLTSCQVNQGMNDTKTKTILLESTGKVETMPNEATFQVNLSCLKPTVKEAKECLVAQSNALMNQLLSHGIKQSDIQTTSVDLQKSYTWTQNSRVFEGYRSSTSVQVKMRDLDKLDIVYTELLENENLEMGGLSYSHSAIDSLKNDAYINALKKADALADKLLQELPENHREVLKVSNVQFNTTNPIQYKGTRALMEASADGGGSVAISKGMIEIEATLFVEYTIK